MPRSPASILALTLLCLFPWSCQEKESSVPEKREDKKTALSFLDFGFHDTPEGDLQATLIPDHNQCRLTFTLNEGEFVPWFYQCPLPVLLFGEDGLAPRREHFLRNLAQNGEARALGGDFRKGDRDYYCQIDVKRKDGERDLLEITLRLDLIEGSSFQELPVLE